MTDTPASRNSPASMSPAGPAPTTMTSASMGPPPLFELRPRRRKQASSQLPEFKAAAKRRHLNDVAGLTYARLRRSPKAIKATIAKLVQIAGQGSDTRYEIRNAS